MISLLRSRICPSCGQKTLEVHCRMAISCTWVRCVVCKSYGQETGKRWCDMRGVRRF